MPISARAEAAIGAPSATIGVDDSCVRGASTKVRLPPPGRGLSLVASGRRNGSSLFGIGPRPESASNRPQLHREARELAGDVQRHAARVLKLLPQWIGLIEL